MSSRVLMSFNFGGTYTCENVRDSHRAAAERWGAQYVEATEPLGETPACDPFGCKLELGYFKWKPGARVALIDGDAIIRADCPSPFELVAEDEFGAVGCFQEGMDVAPWMPVIESRWRDMARYFGVPQEPLRPDSYFNGGLLVFTPALHAKVFAFAHAVARVGTDLPILADDEQNAMNLAARLLGVTVRMLPQEFNRLGPAAWDTEGDMDAFVVHLAAWNGRRTGKADRLSRMDWRAVPAGVCA